MQYFRRFNCTRRHATWRSSGCQSAKVDHQPAVLTTGALRSRLSLKYRRVQFGWFGCPAVHLYHHRSITYGLSSLLSRLFATLPRLTLLHVLPTVYPTPSFPSVASPPHRSDTNQTPPPAPSSCPIPSHHGHLPPTSRAPAKSNPTYSSCGI